MAQKHLAQDLKTKKVKSLPKDLQKIADELLTEKFGEEVVDSSTTFHGHTVVQGYPGGVYHTTWTTGSSGVYSKGIWEEQRFSEDIRATPDFATRRIRYSSSITHPNLRALRDSIERLHRRNLRDVTANVPTDWARELTRSPDWMSYAWVREYRHRGYREECLGEVFGVKVFVSPNYAPEVYAYI